ncbi:hypothetical protein B9G55_16050 [Saccharibacillus sp. O16]|nr:hypothetical protein B9G55_16050 [Saccharibacillus sp. O16]
MRADDVTAAAEGMFVRIRLLPDSPMVVKMERECIPAEDSRKKQGSGTSSRMLRTLWTPRRKRLNMVDAVDQ